jgi:uncharacterized membrane protein
MVNPFDLKTALLAKHAQHVVLIHFPIALFLAAVAFDYLAQWRKNQTLGWRRVFQFAAGRDFDGAGGGVRACGVALGARGTKAKRDSANAPDLRKRIECDDLAGVLDPPAGAAVP